MPSEKSARVSLRKAGYNRRGKSAANTAVAAARKVATSDDKKQAVESVAHAASALDRAAKRGAIHKNNASRRKSRLAKRASSASTLT